MKKPNSRRNLDMAIRRIVGDDEYLSARSLIANVIVCQLMPQGSVKGGTALKVRFGNGGTRATTDLDAARAINLQSFIDQFASSLENGWEGFTARLISRKPAEPVGIPSRYVMQPFDIKLSYLSTPWCTIEFELGFDEIGDADNPDYIASADAARILMAMGFPEPQAIPIMPLSYQIAQKLHGASEPNSKRAHDLIDLQIIVSNSIIDLQETARICRRLFAYRKMQDWPPTVVENDGWASIYQEQSSDIDVLPDIASAVDWTNRLIREIDTH